MLCLRTFVHICFITIYATTTKNQSCQDKMFIPAKFHTFKYLKSKTSSIIAKNSSKKFHRISSSIRLFLMIIIMPLKRCVAKENYLMALLKNEARNYFLILGPWLSIANLRPLSISAPRWRCSYIILSSCNGKFPR